MAADIGIKLGVDGEREFKNSLKSAQTELRLLGNEMKAVSAQFADNANSQEALAQKSGILTRSIDAVTREMALLDDRIKKQKDYLKDLENELAKIVAEQGKESEAAIKAQKKQMDG